MKICRRCELEYDNKTARQWYCESCQPLVKLENSRKNTQNYRVRHNITKNPFVGKGGSIKPGQDHPSWKNGIGTYKRKGKNRLIALGYKCERCSTLIDPDKKGSWATHHKDWDRTNNCDSNLEVLCKRCHQLEHECHKNLPIKV